MFIDREFRFGWYELLLLLHRGRKTYTALEACYFHASSYPITPDRDQTLLFAVDSGRTNLN